MKTPSNLVWILIATAGAIPAADGTAATVRSHQSSGRANSPIKTVVRTASRSRTASNHSARPGDECQNGGTVGASLPSGVGSVAGSQAGTADTVATVPGTTNFTAVWGSIESGNGTVWGPACNVNGPKASGSNNDGH